MERSVIIGLIIVLILLASGVLIKNYSENVVGGTESDQLVLDNLKTCCTYLENGEGKTCSVLEKYDCSLCSAKCS